MLCWPHTGEAFTNETRFDGTKIGGDTGRGRKTDRKIKPVEKEGKQRREGSDEER